jgi:hypothetical protein
LHCHTAGFATLIPVLPTVLTNFFASRHAGTEIDCQQFSKEQQPAACQDAHAGDIDERYKQQWQHGPPGSVLHHLPLWLMQQRPLHDVVQA